MDIIQITKLSIPMKNDREESKMYKHPYPVEYKYSFFINISKCEIVVKSKGDEGGDVL